MTSMSDGPAWRRVFDLDREALSAFAEDGDGDWTLSRGVLAQNAAESTASSLTLPFSDRLTEGAPLIFGVAWSAEMRITRALAASEFVVVDGLNRGMEFRDDGTVTDDAATGASEAVEIGRWYRLQVGTTAMVTVGFGGVEGLSDPDAELLMASFGYNVSGGTPAYSSFDELSASMRVKLDLTGGVALEMRKLAVNVFSATLP